MVKIDDKKIGAKRTVIIFAVLFLFCFLIRFPFLLLSAKVVNSDQAMSGLMGIHILRGDFPVFWWGQGYMGPVDSYLNSIVTYIFGISNINSVIILFFFSIFFPFIAYLLAKEVFGREVGLLSFLFTTLSSWFFTVLWGYTIPLAIGSLMLLLTIRLLGQDDSKEDDYRRHIILGFLSGLGFWINWVILPYLATVGLFLFLRDRLFFLRKPFFLFFVSFLVGSLPFWVFNLTHDFWTFSLFYGEGQRNPLFAAKVLVMDSIPLFLGLKYTEYSWPPYKTILGIAYIILLLSLLMGILKFRNKKGIFVLGIFFFLVCISFILSRWGGLGSARYLFQLFSVIPIMIAFSLSVLKRRSRALFYIFSVVILSANFYAQVDAYRGMSKPSERDPDTKGLINFLKSKNIRYAFSDYSLAPRLTLEAKEEIICAEPTTERYKRYKEILDSSNNFAYVFRKEKSPLDLISFEENIKAKGIGFSKNDVDAFRIFHSFSPPPPESEIPRKGWKAESNFNKEDAHKAFDGDVETAWFSGKPKMEGMWFMIDLGNLQRVSAIFILPGLIPEGGMKGYSIETSADGKNWLLKGRIESNIMYDLDWFNGGPRFASPGIKVKVYFPPVGARYIKITNHGEDKYFNWTIAEVFIYKPAEREVYPFGDLLKEGRMLESKRDYREAMKKYLEVVRSYKDNAEGHYHIMSLMQDLNIPLAPAYERAEVFEKYGLIEKAIENYEFEYKRVYPSGSYGSGIFKHLAALYEKAGNTEKADYFRKRLDEEFSPDVKMDIDFSGEIEFIGYDIKKGRSPEIVYYWKARGNIRDDWKAFVHFTRPDGKVAFQNDHPLFSDDRPSSKWVKGEVYKERLRVEIPQNLRPGTYTIMIGLWDPKTEKRLKVKAGLLKKKDEVTIGELRIIE